MKKQLDLWRQNCRFARMMWGMLDLQTMRRLRLLSTKYGLSIAAGDLQLLENRWYVTHAGLLGISQRKKCFAIKTAVVSGLCDPVISRWIFKATVYKAVGSKGFVSYGDANPSNVSPRVRGAEMRVAETRAVNRALRKAYGIGLCSVEELGAFSSPSQASPERKSAPRSASGNGSNNGQPRLRDRLCLLIRQHQLDPNLVKRYAADFCGTEALRGASRELVEGFINHLAEWAVKDREGLLCKLNSYTQAQEVSS